MNRIDLLASLCKGSNIVCDVGCDHGYVLIKAILDYNVCKGIACDIAEEPLNMAKKNISYYNLHDKIKVLKSDGFKEVNDDFDCAIIAGMGGHLIVDILKSSLDKIKNKKLILQPNSDRDKVRFFLSQNGFKIIDEYSFTDQKKYYEIIVASEGIEYLSRNDCIYGPILQKKKTNDFITHYQNKLIILKKAITNMNDNTEKQKLINEIAEITAIIERKDNE